MEQSRSRGDLGRRARRGRVRRRRRGRTRTSRPGLPGRASSGASFPTLAGPRRARELRVTVASERPQRAAIPDVGGHRRRLVEHAQSEQPGLADPSRPVWVVDAGPARRRHRLRRTPGRSAASRAGQTRTFIWKVTAVRARHPHASRYRVAAGLDGKARAGHRDQRRRHRRHASPCACSPPPARATRVVDPAHPASVVPGAATSPRARPVVR